jgi:hypothetical protein
VILKLKALVIFYSLKTAVRQYNSSIDEYNCEAIQLAARRIELPAAADARRQADKQVGVVGLNFSLVGGFVARDAAAFFAFMDYDISLFRVGLDLYRAEYAAAGVRPVARVYINMERAEAKGTVVSRGVAEGQDLAAAILADKAAIVFLESLVFHIIYPRRIF